MRGIVCTPKTEDCDQRMLFHWDRDWPARRGRRKYSKINMAYVELKEKWEKVKEVK